jgi:hypothetical protein
MVGNDDDRQPYLNPDNLDDKLEIKKKEIIPEKTKE